jgi:hypothetical protein
MFGTMTKHVFTHKDTPVPEYWQKKYFEDPTRFAKSLQQQFLRSAHPFPQCILINLDYSMPKGDYSEQVKSCIKRVEA